MKNNILSQEITRNEIRKNRLLLRIKKYPNKINKSQEKVVSKYIELLDKNEELKKIENQAKLCIEEQKNMSLCSHEINLMNTNSTNPRSLKWKPARRFYYLQEILSDKEDYLELEIETKISPEKESQLIKQIIINPLKISNKLLENLGLKPEWFEDLSLIKQIKYKINILKNIKESLCKTIPLEVSWNINENTWRIILCNDSRSKWYWNIFLFQQSSDWKDRTISNFDNVFTFIRSQKHTLDELIDKYKALQTASEYLKRSESWIKNKDMNNLVVFGFLVKELSKYKNSSITEIAKCLKSINFQDTKKDLENQKKASKLLEIRLREINSQVNNISKELKIIEKIVSEEREKWRNFKKIFSSYITKLNALNPDKIIEEYIKIEKELWIKWKYEIKEIMLKIREKLIELNCFDVDYEARKQAYLWYEIDKKEWKNYISSPDYSEHQYLESLKQKKEYRDKMATKQQKIIEDFKKIIEKYREINNWNNHILDTIYSYLKLYRLSRWTFMPNPYNKVYDKLYWELKNIEKSSRNWDIIWFFRSILAINISIKEQDFFIIINKLEDIEEIKLIWEDEKVREKYVWIIWNTIKSMNKNKFLKSIKIEKNSKTNIKFWIYTKIFNDIYKIIWQWNYDELIKYLKNLKIRTNIWRC